MALTAIATLADVKNYMRVPSGVTTDDATIQVLMNGATKAIEAEVGHIIPVSVFNERHDGGSCEIWLRETPVLEVRSVEEGWGYYNQNLDDQLVNSQPALSIWAYSLDIKEEGLVTRRGPGNVLYPFVSGRDNIRVAYVAGRQTVDGDIVLAFMELVSIWYRQSQLRMSPGQADAIQYNAQDNNSFTRATGDTSINFGVPEAIIEMLKGGRHRPFIG